MSDLFRLTDTVTRDPVIESWLDENETPAFLGSG